MPGKILTLGFQTNPVVWYCLTYFCSPSIRAMKELTQAICFLSLIARQAAADPSAQEHSNSGLHSRRSRLLELLDDPVSPELSGILHLPYKRCRSWLLPRSQQARASAPYLPVIHNPPKRRLTTATQPQAPAPSPTVLKWLPHCLPSFPLEALSLWSATTFKAS